jgi:hypothetical protein
MHEPIKDHVEDYLTRSDSTSLPAEFTAHLVSCADCRDELSAMEKHARIVRVLKATDEIEPPAGFYARVLERIDAQRPISIWSIFLQPFGRRLAYASFALAVLMSVYLVSTEPGAVQPAGSYVSSSNPMLQNSAMLPGEDEPGMVLGRITDAEQNRGAVLVNLATYQEQ